MTNDMAWSLQALAYNQYCCSDKLTRGRVTISLRRSFADCHSAAKVFHDILILDRVVCNTGIS